MTLLMLDKISFKSKRPRWIIHNDNKVGTAGRHNNDTRNCTLNLGPCGSSYKVHEAQWTELKNEIDNPQ